MVTKEEKLKEKRRFKKGTELAIIEDRITELELMIEEINERIQSN